MLAELTNAAGHRTRLAYDAQHHLRHVVAPDDTLRTHLYDQLGRLVQLTDAAGASQRMRYDRLGRLTSALAPDGSERRLHYDGEGNVVYAIDGGQEVHYEYAGQSRLARRRQAATEVRFHYDLEGRLTGLDNEHQETYRFELDALGQVVGEHGFDGLTRRYTRDAAGRVIEIARPAARRTCYRYDTAGRLAEVRHNDEAPSSYVYRPDGALLEASTDAAKVQFERDALGRVTRETQDGVSVESSYDVLGQRAGLHSSLGAALLLERDRLGSVTQMQAGDWFSRIERDVRGLELHRTLSGGVQTGWQRDALGRPISQRVAVGGGALGGPAAGRQRRYEWQGTDQLLSIDDSLTGQTQFIYDALGCLTEARYGDGTEEVRQPDAVGNLFRTLDRTDRRYGPGGQLRAAHGTRYQYDEEGNLIRKTRPSGEVWRYAWDGVGQLVSVTRPEGYAVTFTYDALGRQVSKRYRGKVTKWVWDGDKPLHEWSELEVGPGVGSAGQVLTWLFEEDSFAPAAKLTAQGSYSVVCDHLGTPLDLVRPARGQDVAGAARQLRAGAPGSGPGPGLPLPLPRPIRGHRDGPLLQPLPLHMNDPDRGSCISRRRTRLKRLS